jgi:signal transduction histidine kinase
VAGVAHELNTPLGNCLTTMSSITDSSAKTLRSFKHGELTKSCFEQYFSETKQASELIQSNLNRASKLVQEFKTLSKQDVSSEYLEFNMADVLQEVYVRHSHKYFSHGDYQIDYKCIGTIQMQGEKSILLTIFEQLLENSVIHGFAERKSGTITITCQWQNDNVQILYRDDGSGMSENVIQKAFDPFFTASRCKGHSGIGLHFVFNAVNINLNGSITIESEVGSGTSINILLPKTSHSV